MKLVITEKPLVARNIASVLGAAQKRYGYIEGNGYIVSWCIGHLLELAAPDAYGEQYAKWRYADLPIIPAEWKHVASKDKAAQLKILKDLMERAAADCLSATITAVKQTEKSIAPPKLYDLTTLQREANRARGYTAQQTLDYVQSLYEKKLATYPRTDSRYLTDDIVAGVTALVAALAPDAPCNTAQVINSAQVTDHHAIIPTTEATIADISTLPSGERKILDMLENRLICAVGDKHGYLETNVTLDANGTEFKAKGRIVIHDGWKGIAKPIAADDENGENNPLGEEAAALPAVFDGQTFDNVTAAVKEGTTTPPKHYTEDLLLSAMETAGAEDMPKGTKVSAAGGGRSEPNNENFSATERKGLGTPATRAAIIEKLVKSGFVERAKKNLLPTDKGRKLVAVLPTALASAKHLA